MKKVYYVFSLLLLMMSTGINAFSQVKIASFYENATGTDLRGQDNPVSASAKVADLNAAILSRGPGITYANNSTWSYVAAFEPGETKAQAYTNGSYYQLAVTAEAGKYMSFSAINARLRTSSDKAPNSYRWRYSIDDVSESAFKELGTTDNAIGYTDTQGFDIPETDVSGILDLQSVAPGKTVYFRLYAWGTGTDGTESNYGFGFGKSNSSGREVLSINGIVTAKPMLLSWSHYDTPGLTSSVNSIAKSPLVTTAALVRGAGLDANSYTRGFTSKSLNLSADYTEAVTNAEYYSFNIAPAVNAKVNVESIGFKYRRKGTGADNYQWAYIKDGGSLTLIAGATGLIAAEDDGEIVPEADLTGIADLQNLISTNVVELRLYLWGATDVASVFGIGRDLAVEETSLNVYGTVVDLVALPVTLTSFSAKKQLNDIKLSWKTTSEKNSSHFEVYKSAVGTPNILVGTVSGAGNSTTVNNYSLTDYEAFSGNNYYLLRQVDKDGKFEDFNIISINNVSQSGSQLKAYQNENSVELNVQGATSGKALLQVTDISGRVVYSQNIVVSNEGNASLKIPFMLNSKGVYVATLTGNNTALSTKFIW